MKAITKLAFVALLAISSVAYAEGNKKDCKACTQKTCSTKCKDACGNTECKKACADSTSTAKMPDCGMPCCKKG